MYYLMNDEKTRVILVYLEEVSDGAALMEAARDIINKSGKPVLILKSGRTDEGASAAASHTGSLAGSDDVCNAAFRQAGIIRCDNIEEMFNKAIAFAWQPLPYSNRVAIITNAGGPGVLTTDAAIHEGLQLSRFSEETTKKFKRYLPSTANIKNPVDVIGDARADRYNAALTGAIEDSSVDGIFVILTPQSMTNIEEIAEEVVKVASTTQKPIYTSFMGEADVASGINILLNNKIPHYILPESMCKAFASAYHFDHHHKKSKDGLLIVEDVKKNEVTRLLSEYRNEKRNYLSEYRASAILEAYGLPVVEGKLAKSENEAVKAGSEIGYPVVMKIISRDIIHKSDIGGVILNLKDGSEVKKAFKTVMGNVKKTMPDASIEGVWISRMITDPGEEVIIGIKRDPSFGPVVMFGLGGIYVEIFKDVGFKVAPMRDHDLDDLIQSIKGYPLLKGTRGKNPKDLNALRDSIARIGQLAVDFPEIRELDVNPLIVLEEGMGCYLADARILI
jgi:acetyltransferase